VEGYYGIPIGALSPMVQGGTADVYKVTAGSLPAGIQLSQTTGQITGSLLCRVDVFTVFFRI
jgi:hypothetical protein